MKRLAVSKCPQCAQHLRLPPEWLAQQMRCKHCGTTLQAKDPVAAVAAANAGPIGAVPVVAPGATVPPGYPPPTYAQPEYPAVAYPAEPMAFDPTAADTNYTPTYYRPKKPAGVAGYILLGGFIGMLIVGVLVALLVSTPLAKKLAPEIAEAKSDKPSKKVTAPTTTEPTALAPVDDGPVTTGPFPRRALAICVSNYLYANPVAYGSPQRDVHHLVSRWMQEKWKIPQEQLYELSDGGDLGRAIAPLKPVIEDAITKFTATARPQDRIVLLFIGHMVEIDGAGYLAPIEAELTDKEAMIPLKWVYDQLAACKAQQKLFLVDTGRVDPSRGLERPGSGPMSDKLDDLLKNPPAGVQVWSASTKGQYSHEFDYAAFNNREMFGGVFLNQFIFSSASGKVGIQRPDNPFPVEGLSEIVSTTTTKAIQALVKSEQTPRLSGTMPAQIAYNPKEPPAPRFELMKQVPGKGKLADRDDIRMLLAEIEIPPIKLARKGNNPTRLEGLFPFTADVMDAYKADYKSTKELIEDAKKYPLRVTTLKALTLLREVSQKNDNSNLPEELRGGNSDARKAELLKIQQFPARFQLELEEMLGDLEKVGANRKDDKSKRWQAHYDYVTAQLKFRLAYIYEYNLMLGKVRKDELPPLDEKLGHKGWRLASQEKLQSGKEAREWIADAKKLLNKIVKDHAGTPWEVLAKRERFVNLGLSWQPSTFDGN
jgi:hypothetical protein